jgi:pimeloyl-ACP methyl ester carboxylesterase
MIKKALLLHGTGGDSNCNWFPWLRAELENAGWAVWVPDLPHADKPNIRRYNEYILSNKDWVFDDNTIVVGHSSGAVAALGLLQALPESAKVAKAILVGSFSDTLG